VNVSVTAPSAPHSALLDRAVTYLGLLAYY